MDDILQELENMVCNASSDAMSPQHESIDSATIGRWQSLFGFSASEAEDQIIAHRANIARTRISDSLWELVEDKAGYDREAYEFEMDFYKTHKRRLNYDESVVASEVPFVYLVKLEGTLESCSKVQEIAGLAQLPRLVEGVGESGDSARFCIIDRDAKDRILAWYTLTDQRHSAPVIVRLSESQKDLCSDSIAPTLGVDATFPQNRLNHEDDSVGVSQDQFPVPYFVYGNLAKHDILTENLGLTEPPAYRTAKVRGGLVRRFKDQYNALIDGPPDSIVDGLVYVVESKEHEDLLRFRETKNYEVVRCNIEVGAEMMEGLAFRYSGPTWQLR